MLDLIWADTETGSTVDLKSAGTYRYAEDPSTHIQLFSYALNDGEVKIWDPHSGEEVPDDLCEYFDNPKYVFVFHNAQFDRLMIENCLGIRMPIQRYRCTMAQALSHALPASLEKWEEVMGIKSDFQKIKDGKRLVLKFCKPRKRKDGSMYWCTPETDPEDWARYKEYCRIDTAGMREASKKTPNWNYPSVREREYWFMDQTMNDRGMKIDMELVDRAVEVIIAEQKELAKKTFKMTNEEVKAASQRDAMLAHILKDYGLELENMQKATIEKIVEDVGYPEALRELLRVRLDTCTTATAKYKKLQKVTCADGRLHGAVMFAGASRTLRDCLAENTLILVLTIKGHIEEKPIQFVEITDKVWDGLEWVSHDGVEEMGKKAVIVHDSICATPEHMVYLEDEISISLYKAQQEGLEIWSNLPKNI